MLTEHVGGEPTVAQRALIARIAWIELRCNLFDRKAISDNEAPYDVNIYLAHANSLKRLYQALGIEKSRPSFARLMRGPTAAGRRDGASTWVVPRN